MKNKLSADDDNKDDAVGMTIVLWTFSTGRTKNQNVDQADIQQWYMLI